MDQDFINIASFGKLYQVYFTLTNFNHDFNFEASNSTCRLDYNFNFSKLITLASLFEKNLDHGTFCNY